MSIFIGSTSGANSTPKLLRDYAKRIGAKYSSRVDAMGRPVTRIYFPNKYVKRILTVKKSKHATDKPWWAESVNDYRGEGASFGSYATLQELVDKLNENINKQYGAWYAKS